MLTPRADTHNNLGQVGADSVNNESHTKERDRVECKDSERCAYNEISGEKDANKSRNDGKDLRNDGVSLSRVRRLFLFWLVLGVGVIEDHEVPEDEYATINGAEYSIKREEDGEREVGCDGEDALPPAVSAHTPICYEREPEDETKKYNDAAVEVAGGDFYGTTCERTPCDRYLGERCEESKYDPHEIEVDTELFGNLANTQNHNICCLGEEEEEDKEEKELRRHSGRGGTRTLKLLRALAPKANVSANFPTRPHFIYTTRLSAQYKILVRPV